MLGLEFYPDVDISYRGSRLLAIENKFLDINRQRDITNAIGQASIYTIGGYLFAATLLLDRLLNSYLGYDARRIVLGNEQLRVLIKRRNHLGDFIRQ